MSIPDLAPVAVFEGDGTRGPFPFVESGVSIPYATSTHLFLARVSAAGVITALTEEVDYTISETLNSTTNLYSGSFTLTAEQDVLAEADGSTPAERLVAYRLAVLDQNWTLQFNQRFPSTSFTQLQNKIVMALQDLRALVLRAPLLPAGDDPATFTDRLVRKGKVVGFDVNTGAIRAMTLAEGGGTTEVLLSEYNLTASEDDQTEFTLAGLQVSEPAAVLVWVGGSWQPADSYTLTIDGEDTLLTLGGGVADGVAVDVRVIGVNAINAAQAATISGLAAEIEALAAIDSAISAVAAIDSDVTTVAGIAADVTAVAAISADVALAADHIADIQAAPAAATAAAASELAADASATAAAGSASTATTQAGLASASASAAATSAGNAATAETNAETAETNAETAQAAAEAARDAARQAASGLAWAFDSNTADSDPGAGELRLNNATIASASFIYVSETDAFGANVAAALGTIDDSTSATKAVLILRRRDAPENYAIFTVTGALTDGGAYEKIPVSYQAGAGTFSAADVLTIMVWRVGDKGDSGSGTGDLLASNNLSELPSPSTARTNLGLSANGSNLVTLTYANMRAALDLEPGVDFYSITAADALLALKAPLASPAFTGNPTVPTQSQGNNSTRAASTAYVDTAVGAVIAAANAMVFKGVIDCSANPNYPAADAGDTYKVSVAGKIGGASGPNVQVGDTLLCTADSTASGNHATVGSSWNISQVNIDGAVTGPTSAVSGRIATFNGTTGQVIQDSGFTTSSFQTASAVLTTWAGLTPSANAQSLVTAANYAAMRALLDLEPGVDYVTYANALQVGVVEIFIPAGAMTARTTNGAGSGTAESTTNKVMQVTKDFDQTTQEYVQFTWFPPKSWNLSTVSFIPVCIPGGSSGGWVFDMAGVAISNDDVIDAAFGTAQTSVDSFIAATDVHVGPESSAITIAGTPAAGDFVVFQLSRVTGNGSDTHNGDVKLLGIKLRYTINAANDT